MVGGVRKGAWTEAEDSLLKKCVEKYGEGKWHQVPHRAGLNRCRKSCRLRWLNYLRPNIKRGSFTPDEVDLIIRLHKLLGNRWSLIAGRLSGRTANDVKNYWNTHQTKKYKSKQEHELRTKKTIEATTTPESKLFKPRPRTFIRPNIIKSLFSTQDKLTTTRNINDEAFSSTHALENSDLELFEGLFENDGEEAGGSWPFQMSGEKEEVMNRFWSEEIPSFHFSDCHNQGHGDGNNEDKQKSFIWGYENVNESDIDMDIWDIFGSRPHRDIKINFPNGQNTIH